MYFRAWGGSGTTRRRVRFGFRRRRATIQEELDSLDDTQNACRQFSQKLVKRTLFRNFVALFVLLYCVTMMLTVDDMPAEYKETYETSLLGVKLGLVALFFVE